MLASLAMILLVATIVFRSYATARGIPLLAGDACVFLPQTIPFQQRGELVNVVWRPASDLDARGEGRMVYHGFLYPMLLSVVMWQADYVTLSRVLAVLQGGTMLFFCVFLWSFAKRWQWRLTSGRILLIGLLVVACANYLRGAVGRPESLAALLLMVGVLLVSATPPAWHGWIAGIGIGALTVIDPVVGGMAGLAFAGAAAWWLHPRRWFWTVAGAAGLSVSFFVACLFWYPYAFADWWSGTLKMANYAFADGIRKYDLRSYLSEYLWSGSGWFLFGTLTLALWSAVRLIRRQYLEGTGPVFPAALFAMLVLAGAALSRFVLYASWAKYNVLPFMPIGFLAIFYELGRTPVPNSGKPTAFRRAAFLILAIASLGLAGDLVERVHTMRFGLDLAQARDLFGAVRKAHAGEVIALPENLFTLTENYSNIIFWNGSRPPAKASLLVTAQFYSGRATPPPIDGFQVVANHFNPQRPFLFGIPVSRGDRGSGFAVYSRNPAASP